MAEDYPDGYSRGLYGQQVNLDPGFSLPWVSSTNLTIAASATSSFTIDVTDPSYVFYVDMIMITPAVNTVLSVEVTINGRKYLAAAGSGFILFTPRTNPSISLIEDESITITVKNLDASTRTFSVIVNGSKIIRPAGFLHAPTANFTFTPSMGFVPFNVQFTEDCYGSPASWEWTLNGIDVVSTAQNPLVSVDTPGTLYPTLTCANEKGEDTYVSPNSIFAVPSIDLSQYTEVDDNNYFSISGTEITATNVVGVKNDYIYKDYGANYFNGYDMLMRVKLTSGTNGGYLNIFSLANSAGIVPVAGTVSIILNFLRDGSGNYNLCFYLYNGASQIAYNMIGVTADTVYLLRITHTAGTNIIKCDLYTDFPDMTYINYISINNALVNTKFRYHNVAASFNYAGGGVMSAILYNRGFISVTP